MSFRSDQILIEEISNALGISTNFLLLQQEPKVLVL